MISKSKQKLIRHFVAEYWPEVLIMICFASSTIVSAILGRWQDFLYNFAILLLWAKNTYLRYTRKLYLEMINKIISSIIYKIKKEEEENGSTRFYCGKEPEGEN